MRIRCAILGLFLIASCTQAPKPKPVIGDNSSPSPRLATLRQQSLDEWGKGVDVKLEQQPAEVRQAVKLAFEAGYDRALRDVSEAMPKVK